MSAPLTSDRRGARADVIRLLLVAGALVVLGLLLVFAAGIANGSASARVLRQGLWLVPGAAAFALAAALPGRWLAGGAWPILGAAVILLAAVLVPGVGVRIRGAQRWLELGAGQRFQPSELAKIAVVIFLAAWFARRPERAGRLGAGLLFPLGLGLVLADLVRREPDLGSAGLILAAVFFSLYLAGVRLSWLALTGAAAAAGLLVVCLHYPHAVERLRTFLDPGADPRGSGYHLQQSLIVLGSGGWFGQGLGQGRHGFLPDGDTDFIFAILGGELGFAGALLTLGLFAALIWLAVRLAWRAADRFDFLLAGSLSALLGLQVLINVAVVTGCFPTKGLCLPLVSYGGSSLVASLGALGLIAGVGRRAARAAVRSGEEIPAGANGLAVPA